MASRDVELVIKARDQSSKVVDAVTKALNSLVDAEGDASKASAKVDTAFTRFAKSVGTLDKALGGLSSLERVTKNFNQAETATNKLEASLAETRQEVGRLSSDLDKAKAATASYAKQVAATGKDLQKQKDALKATGAAHKSLNAELRDATTARGVLQTAEKNLTTTISTQDERLTKTTERYNRLSGEVAAVAEPTARMVSSLEAANVAMTKQQAKLDTSRAKLGELKTAITTAEATVAGLTAKLAQSAAGLLSQKAALDSTKDGYAKLQTQASAASTAQIALGKAYEQSAGKLAATEAELTQANAAMAELRVKAGQAQLAMADLAAAAQGPLVAAFRAQQSVVSRINNVYQENRTELAALSALMGQVGVPTREMAEAYARLNAVSREVQNEFRQQSTVLKGLGVSLKEAVTDSDQLAAKQREFGAALQGGSAALARVSTETAKAATASQRLVAENRKAQQSYVGVTQAATGTAGATNNLAQANDKAAESYRRSANASRQAMSFTQRLRGEVLALVSAYGGLFGVITVLNDTVKAYQTLEAATSRLRATNDGDMSRTADDLDFIRRNADRLGIQFGLLADEYTKFSASTKKTILEGKATRDVFISIAEAGRVNKLSFEDMQGVFRAVIQIASKGKFQLEELQGQLGDRLPGAVQILADGLGITVEELQGLTKEGKVASSALLNFAGELDKRYGSALQASLETTTTAMGRLQNAVFQALVVFGEGGFIEGFTVLIKDLTETLQSPAFQDFATRMSAIFGGLARLLGTVAKNFDVVTFAISGFIGIKLSGVLVAWGSQFLKLGAAATGSAAGVTAAGTAAATTGTAAAAAAGRVGLLAGAFRALLSSTGIGLAITGVTLALGYWATRASEATTAMVAHKKIVDIVKNAYDAADGASKDWAKTIKNTTETEAKENLKRLEEAAKEARAVATRATQDLMGNESVFTALFGSDEINKQTRDLRKLMDEFASGSRKLDDYKAALDKIAKDTSLDESTRRTATTLLQAAEGTREFEVALKEAALIVKTFGPNSEEAQAAIKELSGSLDESATAAGLGAAGLKKYEDALAGIKSMIPELADELKKLKDQMELDEYIKQLGMGPYTAQQQALIDKAQGAINTAGFKDISQNLSKFTDGLSAAAALIADKEKFRAIPYNDGNRDDSGKMINTVYRAGFGSDTVTLSDNTIHKITAGSRVSMEDATRDLNRRVQEFASKVVTKIGADDFGAMNPQQQAVLTSIAYNYGNLPDRIAKVINEGGTTAQIAEAIKGLGNDNGGINRNRRNEEAFLFGNGEFDEAAGKRAADEQERKTKSAKEYHETLLASNEAAAFELTLKDQDIVKQETAKQIREAELAAKKAGTVLSQQERDTIAKNVELKYREQAVQDGLNEKKKKAEEAEQKVNDLLAKRAELEAQMDIYTESGDTEKAAALKTEIEGINTELTAAIANAQAMWGAVGGTAADAANAKLQTTQLEIDKFSQGAKTALIDWTAVGELFASGLTNAFDRFAQAVAEGEDIGKAASDAFLQFAADFLIEIGKMILQQALLNAIRGLGGVFAGVGVGHTGGMVGSRRVGGGNASRKVDPGIFATAPRFHEGANVGLKPNEVPAVLKKNEEVLNEHDPRNALNGGLGRAAAASGGQPAGRGDIKIVNTFDSGDVVSHGLSTAPGEAAFLNIVRSNAQTIKSIIE